MKIKINKGTINLAILNSVLKRGQEDFKKRMSNTDILNSVIENDKKDYERRMNNHELYRKFQIADILVQAEQRYHDRLMATIEMEQNASGFIIGFCAAYNLQ